MTRAMTRPVLACCLLASLALSCQGPPSGQDSTPLARVVVPAGEVHEGWYFAAGDEVTIEGTINGDAYVAGGIVRVAGTINGDLLAAGGEVLVTGTVTDDIRAAGGQLRFSGSTGKNISAAGGTITLERPARLEGGLLVAGGSVSIAGTVEGEARTTAGALALTGTVKRDLYFSGKSFAAYRGASVGGALHVLVEEAEHVELADGVVTGAVQITTRQPTEAPRILGFAAWHFWAKVLWALSLVVTALFLAFTFPRQLVHMGTTIASRPWASALWGVLTFILAPVLVVLLAMTLLAIPLALLALFFFLWLLYLTQLGLGVVLAHWLMGLDGRRGWSLFGAVVMGIVAVQVLTFIPYVRHVVTLLGIVFGLGALCLVFVREVQLNRAAGDSRSASGAPGPA